jgi:predicted Fe-Mo cluster-binding NifX family protein
MLVNVSLASSSGSSLARAFSHDKDEEDDRIHSKVSGEHMKIAVVTEDRVTISQHFGRAPFYLVVTVEDGRIVSRETRDKLGHAQLSAQGGEAPHQTDPRGHGFDPAAQDRHTRMVTAIADCQVLLARGMGAGAYESMKQAGIRPIVTDLASIEDAIEAYLAGTLKDHPETLH